MAMLEAVPKVVMFRGWEKERLQVGAGARRTLLLKNVGEEEVEALLTQPLSGLFELQTAAPTDDEPEFFHTFTLPAKSTVKMVIVFKPDTQALQLYNNFQDVLIVHAPGAIMEVPIKACQCSDASERAIDDEFCPSSTELDRWKRTLLQELGPPPPLLRITHTNGAATVGGAGDERLSGQAAVELTRTEGTEREQPVQPSLDSLLPPMGLSMAPRKAESAPVREEGPPVLQPAVAIMGRTAVVSRQHASLRHPEASARAERMQSLPPQTSQPNKPTVFLINGILCDARGQPTLVDAADPSELRRRYNIIVCGKGSIEDHFSGGKPYRKQIRDPALTEATRTSDDAAARGNSEPLSVKALAEAVAGLGLTLEDLPPNPAMAALAASVSPQTPSQTTANSRLGSSRTAVCSPQPPSTPLQSRDSARQASDYSPGAYKASPPSLPRGRSSRLSTPISTGARPSTKLDQATLEANWDAL